jgi:hypothetical protein
MYGIETARKEVQRLGDTRHRGADEPEKIQDIVEWWVGLTKIPSLWRKGKKGHCHRAAD